MRISAPSEMGKVGTSRRDVRGRPGGPSLPTATGAFTMVEIAICLAVIGFALVAIIGVLPIGMSVQKENREDTIINFDANYLMDAIRSGSRGLDNLTNYVVIITNITTLCNSNGVPSGRSLYSTYSYIGYTNGTIAGGVATPGPGFANGALTNGATIMPLLSWPKYVPADTVGNYWSNYVSADFRAITGSPLDQGTSQASKDFAFVYRVTVEIVPSASFPYYATGTPGLVNFTASPGQLTNAPTTNQVLNGWQYAKNLQANMYDIRLRFRWPVLANGTKLGNGDRVFRSSISGDNGPFVSTNFTSLPPGPPYAGNPSILYLMQPQSYSPAQ